MVETTKPGFYPITHPQKRIWYLEKIHPNTPMHNIGGTIHINGSVDYVLLEKAIQHFIGRHEGVRLQFVEWDDEPHQTVEPYVQEPVEFIDFSVHNDPEARLRSWEAEQAGRPFRLENNRLYYFAVMKISEQQSAYFVKLHHLIADGWSVNIMTELITSTYIQLLRCEPPDDTAGSSYLGYLDIEQDYLQSDRFRKDRTYWTDKYRTLPESFLHKGSDDYTATRQTLHLDERLSGQIKQLVSQSKWSINTFFVTLLLIYLNKTTQEDDLLIGTPVLNRSGKKERAIFGMFTSTMPLRVGIDAESTVIDFMDVVHKEMTACYYHQKYPYDLLVKDLELSRYGYDGLFQVCVNYYNTKLNTTLNGARLENIEFHSGHQMYSLQLVIKDWTDTGSITLDLDYKVGVYGDEQIAFMFRRLEDLIRLALAEPQRRIKEVHLLFEDEWRELIQRKNRTSAKYPGEAPIHELFEQQAERTPHRIAAECEGHALTFLQLNERSNQLARLLVQRGVTKNTIVGLMTEHSLETVVGILGILKAGGAYVPIDPSYPPERIRYIAGDSGASIVLTNNDSPIRIPDYEGELIALNDPGITKQAKENISPARSGSDDLVYLIYTSGSTGKPKGTMIRHRGLVNYIWWAKQAYIQNDDDAFALYSSLSFDLTVTSVFTPLLSGTRMVIYRSDDTEFVLYHVMRDNRTHIIKLTPSHLSLLKDWRANSVVHTFIVGGEDLKASLARDIHHNFGGSVTIFNEYGPTETVVGCMIDKYCAETDFEGSVPIGTPISNVQLYVLDRYRQPLPHGLTGELYISGDGVAAGYLNRQELTMERFVDNPFVPGTRMYKSGDLVRWRPDGRMEYVGRADVQMKIRGHRIEPGEIENAILTMDGMEETVVMDRDDGNGGKYLCAYIKAGHPLSEQSLRRHLEQRLPLYMIPSHFIEVDSFLLTPNGKIDRSVLPEPKLNITTSYAPALYQTEKETTFLSVVREVLRLEDIGGNDNFYYVGGDSIKAIQIASKLKDKGLLIKVKDILAYPVMKEMVSAAKEGEQPETLFPQEPAHGIVGFTPITAWFFAIPLRNPQHWNQSVLLKLKRDISRETFCTVLSAIAAHHDAFRLNVNEESRLLNYNPAHLSAQVEVKVFDLSAFSSDEQDVRIRQLGEQLKAGMDWTNSLLLKACMFELGKERGNRLLLTAHHLVIDGVSWRIVLEDLAGGIEQLEQQKTVRLPAKTNSVQKWAESLAQYARGEALQQVAYWKTVDDCDFELSADLPGKEGIWAESSVLKAGLSREETEYLLGQANIPYRTEGQELLVMALALTLSEYTGRDEVVLELEGHGREDLGTGEIVTRTVGWFTSMYPVKLNVAGVDLSSRIKLMKEQLRAVPHKGIGYGVLTYLSGMLDRREQQIRFNYLGDAQIGSSWFDLAEEETGSEIDERNPMTCLLDIRAVVVNHKLSIQWIYSTSMFHYVTISSLLDRFLHWLQVILRHCCDKDGVEFTPSDFDSVTITQNELDELFS